MSNEKTQSIRVELECPVCGNHFEKLRSRMKYAKNHFCSLKCSDEHKKTFMKGKNNPAYGKVMSAEQKEKRSVMMKEMWKDEEYVSKVLASRIEAQKKHLEDYGAPLGWSAEAREKRITTIMENFGYKHNWSSPEVRERCEQTCVERHGSTSQELMGAAITKEVIERRRRTLIETMVGVSYEEYESKQSERDEYYQKVRRITEAQPLQLLEGYEERGPAELGTDNLHLDHIVPIMYGFLNEIPAEIIGDISNLRFIHWRENIVKGATLLESK